MAEAATALEHGFMLTFDYGGPVEELYAVPRHRGTVQCYYNHTVSDDPYIHVGEQDITAHVDFTALERAGRHYGLTTMGFTGQAEFLITLGALAFQEVLAQQARSERRISSPIGTEEKDQTSRIGQDVYLSNRMGIEELLRPNGLGGFRVLAQSRGISSGRLWGFWPENPHRQDLLNRVADLQIPLRGSCHAPLLEGRYPHQGLTGGFPNSWDEW